MGIETAQRTLCIFIHYSNTPYIPQYVVIYVNELSNYFDEVILVTNERQISNTHLIQNQNISLVMVKNEGYDFGMFYKVFRTIDPSEYSQIACINDSNVLFNKLTSIFEWGKSTNYDFWGLIDSRERPDFSTHQDNYHIQSHFLVFNTKAIGLLPVYFDSLNIESLFKESDLVALKHSIINYWEIGLTQFMMQKGISLGSYISSMHYSKLYLRGQIRNVLIRLYAQLIRSGLPLIKRSIIFKPKMKHFWKMRASWKGLLRKYGHPDWDIENIIVEMEKLKKL